MPDEVKHNWQSSKLAKFPSLWQLSPSFQVSRYNLSKTSVGLIPLPLALKDTRQAPPLSLPGRNQIPA